MDFSHLNIGIIHSLVGKNDGVSIVIDQSVTAMCEYMGVSVGNIYYLAAHASRRFNTTTDDVFWHKNSVNKAVVANFAVKEFSAELEHDIDNAAFRAKKIIASFVDENQIDLIFAHNISHPYNFTTAVGLNLYLEDRRGERYAWPKVIAWWHDSYFERPVFDNPNERIKKYLKYLPGVLIDGVVFINEGQVKLYSRYLLEQGCYNGTVVDDGDLEKGNCLEKRQTDVWERIRDPLERERFITERTSVIPNTSEITWDWEAGDWSVGEIVFPPQDNYNDSFFDDIGLMDDLGRLEASMEDVLLLLQHTRVVPRKRIDLALELAFELYERNDDKVAVLFVSGHSGDEQSNYCEQLNELHANFAKRYETNRVLLIFGEAWIQPHREIIVDKKYYAFDEIPAIIAGKGGIGTYFSEIEGFGNNLLEMMSAGLPVLINRYEVYKKDIERYGFDLPYIDDCVFDKRIVDDAFRLLTDIEARNSTARHNLAKLAKNLSHELIAEKLKPLLSNIFFKSRM